MPPNQDNTQDTDQQQTASAPTHGETVDLSNDEIDDDQTHYSDVPVRPEVQEEIDRYYEKKAEMGEPIDQDQEPGDTTDDEPSTQAGTTEQEPEPPDPDPREFAQPAHDTDNSPGRPDNPAHEPEPKPEPEPQSGPDPEPEPEGTIAEQAQAPEGEDIDLDSIDLDSIENQEWGLGRKRDPKMHTLKGMKFLFTEPDDDDTVVNSIQKIRQDDMMSAFFALCQITVKAPKITEERWSEQMTATERIALGHMVLNYLQAQDF